MPFLKLLLLRSRRSVFLSFVIVGLYPPLLNEDLQYCMRSGAVLVHSCLIYASPFGSDLDHLVQLVLPFDIDLRKSVNEYSGFRILP